ncbi:carboxymuconolactone decarboxylase family protein (plasmid) [Ruegeria pomeroyi DSS-3]|uniref:Carboxymuconolactone decarboxylase family protein n=2 Tax=Ruegeria pomeroyi TaxID=89184 RepID=Q5LKN5_RUEPO|nr:carboxymuconolactone decarboxylase family protein [Ruegeria pomeroyi]AAV97478.1 carboxymuconolactone decarboxylase family protein [Ruegeria pomeroyi DSS-3]NVK97812.1 carboxymuconolactone decarboxylase family protein [Ruegeria pomeroyi]NVL02528.1 carboxymuconolactone decarboxylase family protein [Ruegeria pomeroyi]HCE71838.1 carboxymuconolactone decarboxylase [Ruegeria sp.]
MKPTHGIERDTLALAILDQLESGASERVSNNLDAFDASATELILGFSFADVLSREGIDLRTREMLTVAMLGAKGTAPGQLDFHMRAALNCGVTRPEIVEIIYQIAVYAGVPAAMNAITSAKKAFEAANI